MKKQQILQRLEKIVESDLDDLKKNLILSDKNGYLAFGIYQITSRQNRWITAKNNVQVGEFSSAKSALSWCVADKYNQHRLSQDILRLDSNRLMLMADIRVRNAIGSSNKFKEAKIETRKHRLQQLDFQLDKCINLAKYWQIRGFNNETARTGRTTPNRTNRQSFRESTRHTG